MSEFGDCDAPLPPLAQTGLEHFNARRFFEAHEALEAAWRAEPGPIRALYQGLLQVAVAYLHIERGNFDGALKVAARGRGKLAKWPPNCRGVNVGRLIRDLDQATAAVRQLGAERLRAFNPQWFQPVEWGHPQPARAKRVFTCDRCGAEMVERNCKVTCPNCGNRFDCSDLNIYFD